MMNVIGKVVIDVFGFAALAGWLVGFVNYLRIFREALAAGRKLGDLFFFGVYEYAFDEKKGSSETRWMVRGFGTMLGCAILLMVFGLFTSRH